MNKRKWRRWAPAFIALWLLAGWLEFGHEMYEAGFWGGAVFVVSLGLFVLVAYRTVG